MSSELAAPKPLPRFIWVIAFVGLAALVVFAFISSRAAAPAVSSLDKYGQAPEFRFTAQDGAPLATADLKGKVWVANFIFTRCQGPCPIMTSHMAQLNQSLGPDVKDVHLVSFTVDPEYDTPPILKKYGENVSAEPGRWSFLTGAPDEIRKVIIKGFLQALDKTAAGDTVHSTRFVLVDRNGTIRGFRDGDDPELNQKLLMDIQSLLREPTQG